jgi:hypothetical protein
MTTGDIVVLTRHERKDRLGHGGVKAVAEELGVDAALVSRVVNDKQRHSGVEESVARRVIRRNNEIAFPPREEFTEPVANPGDAPIDKSIASQRSARS